MTAPASQIVQNLWNYCNILGLSYGDYVEQLTFLLFPRAGLQAPSTSRNV